VVQIHHAQQQQQKVRQGSEGETCLNTTCGDRVTEAKHGTYPSSCRASGIIVQSDQHITLRGPTISVQCYALMIE